MPRLLPGSSSLLISTLPVHSPAFFSKTSPDFFLKHQLTNKLTRCAAIFIRRSVYFISEQEEEQNARGLRSIDQKREDGNEGGINLSQDYDNKRRV